MSAMAAQAPSSDVLFFALVDYDGTILASQNTGIGEMARTVSQLAGLVQARAQSQSQRQSFVYRGRQFHCLQVPQLSVFIVAVARESGSIAASLAPMFRARVNLLARFMRDDDGVIHALAAHAVSATTSRPPSQPNATSGRIDSHIEQEFEELLSISLDSIPVLGNTAPGDKARAVSCELTAVKTSMLENIDRVLDRGERIHLLVDRSAQLNHEAVLFARGAVTTRHRMWLAKLKTTLLGATVLLGLVYLFLGGACGFALQHCI